MKMLKPATKMASICIGIIALAGFFCFLVSQKLRIDKPVFYQIYGAYPVYRDEEYMNTDDELFPLPYLICRGGDVRRINDVSFHKVPPLTASKDDVSLDNPDDQSFFAVESFAVEWDGWSEEEDNDYDLTQPAVLTSADVMYNNGKTETVELGEIILYQVNVDEKEPLEITSEAGFDDVDAGGETGELVASAQDNLKLVSVACVPVPAGGAVRVNGKKAYQAEGMAVKKGERLAFTVTLPKKEAGVVREPALQVVCETKDGKQHIQFLTHFTQRPYGELGFLQAIDMARERGMLE